MQTPPFPKASLVNPAEAWWASQALREDRSARILLQAEASGGRHQRSLYELFGEMLEKDGHLYSVVQTRLNGLLGLRRRLLPPPPAHKAAGRTTEFLEQALGRIPRFEELLRALLDGIAKGFTAIELQWGYGPGGELYITDWRAMPQEWFAFYDEGELLLLSPPFRAPRGRKPAGDSLPFTGEGRGSTIPETAFPAPPRTFLLLRFGADRRNPYGRGLCQHAYWPYWFKKNALKFWALHNEKYGAPTAVATYPQGTREEDRRGLEELLDTLQTDSGVLLPEGIRLSLLETARSGGGSTYRELIDWCNDEMSKVVLGATLTSGEGRRSGSLALGNIHQLVRQDYIESDARLLEGVLNESLVAWLMELNFGPDAPRPQWRIETDSPEDLNARIRVDRELLNLGVTLPKSYFYRQYGRPAPTDEDTPLRYDDANFYQYHLQFGVLTVNEVRHRLNLPPVPWGDQRTAVPDGDPPPAPVRSAEDEGRPVR